ncbi:MAG: class I SAM-dependent methyltransferase [Candidatus Woesebacteria bacterium]|nr:MAG: class I SAM-dependent methyltransferase [Candidatus Woesebacteria bacterium]
MNTTLGNVDYSIAHTEILGKSDRVRVAKQLLTIVQVYLNHKNLKSFLVLDIGCSSGIITREIAKHSRKVIGIDVDGNAIKKAAVDFRSVKNLKFRVAKGEKIPFRKNFFDIVFCNQVYSYVSNPHKMMLEIKRVLKPGGICLFTGDNLLRPVEPLYRLPFIRLLPKNITKYILSISGYKSYYIGSYKSYWGLKKLCNNFVIEDYTLEVIKHPKKYKFSKILKYEKLINFTPSLILKLLEPFLPTFIFILKKN